MLAAFVLQLKLGGRTMKLAFRKSIQISLLFAGLYSTAYAAPDSPPCSTEKVNHENCSFIINRWYPVTFPTIQMSQGKQIIVKLVNQLPFESVTLDSTGTTLLPGSDQGAALLTAPTSRDWSSPLPSSLAPHPAYRVNQRLSRRPVHPLLRIRSLPSSRNYSRCFRTPAEPSTSRLPTL
jgi:hypothetical protein